MKILTVKSLVDFRRKSDRSKKTFVANLKSSSEKEKTEGGRHYWIGALSALSNAHKNNDSRFIKEKIQDLEQKRSTETRSTVRAQYTRNIDVLTGYRNFDFTKWIPSGEIKFLRKAKEDMIITIKDVSIEVKPQQVFTIQKNKRPEVGAIWFIAQKEGFRKDELGMFADTMYRYLKKHFAKNQTVNQKYCIAVDMFNREEVKYSDLESGRVPLILSATLDEVKSLM